VNAVRRAAFVTLFFLGSLNAASLSALHIDLPQSHSVQCEPASPRFDCHADLPHEHDAAHAGEESLFEYIFEVSREAPATGNAAYLEPVMLFTVCAVRPVGVFAFLLPADASKPLSALLVRRVNPRAPPLCA